MCPLIPSNAMHPSLAPRGICILIKTNAFQAHKQPLPTVHTLKGNRRSRRRVKPRGASPPDERLDTRQTPLQRRDCVSCFLRRRRSLHIIRKPSLATISMRCLSWSRITYQAFEDPLASCCAAWYDIPDLLLQLAELESFLNFLRAHRC